MAVPPSSFVPSNQVQELLNTAIQHHRAGQLSQAEEHYRKVLALKADHPDALHLLGILAGSTGHIDAAIDLISQAIKAYPTQPLYYNTLADFLRQAKRLEESLIASQKAVNLKPDYAEAYNNMGFTFNEMKRRDEAVAAFRKAIQIAPNLPDAHNNLSAVLRDAGQPEEAIVEARKAISLNPNSPLFHFNLALALSATKNQEQALPSYHQAIKMVPDFMDAHYALGLAYVDLQQYDNALTELETVVSLNPKHGEAWNSLGVVRWHKGWLTSAIHAFQSAIEANPKLPSPQYNLGTLQLLTGDFEHGWDGYEWRWSTTSVFFTPRSFAKPQWDGSSLAGKTLLLHVEQGYGDSIQFIRYVPIVKAMGARVILGCQPSLFKLMGAIPGIDEIVQEVNDTVVYDMHCPLLSLPRILKTRLENIPANIPYIHADPQLVEQWKQKFSFPKDKLKVGLVWTGSKTLEADKFRSIPLAKLAPLGAVKNVVFYSLQKGAGTYQPSDVPSGMELIDAGPDIKEFTDTAAIISQLDLVITVDTAAAHLAGAMGKPTWIFIRSHLPEWRWLLERSDSPWYPTARLFRQTVPADWTGAVQNVATELQTLASQPRT